MGARPSVTQCPVLWKIPTSPPFERWTLLLGPLSSRCLVECHPFHHPGPPSTGQGVPAVSAVLVGAEDGALCPICQSVADALGDHHVGCGGNGDRILRHDSIRDALFSAAQSAALAPRKESFLDPADVYLPYWVRGQPAALDVTVISTLQQQTLTGAASIPGHALQVGEDRKMAAHADTCRAVGVVFVPLVMETLGVWCDEAIRTICRVGRQQGQHLGITPAESTRHLFQCLAISLWRGNATLWLRRQPIRPASVDSLV